MSTSSSNESQKDFASPQEEDVQILVNLKRSKFAEMISWLQSWGYKVVDKTNSVIITGIELQAEVIPRIPYSSGLSTPF